MRRQYVTLLEMLIVMTIIVVIAGAVMIGLEKALVEQRFRDEVGKVVDDLRLAQDLMMILGMDVHVKFTEQQKNQGIEYKLETETAINKNLQHLMIDKVRTLKTIRGVFFEDTLDDQNIEGVLDLKFFSRGVLMSQGVLRLSISSLDRPPNGVLETYIYLAGHPQPIFSDDHYNVVNAESQSTEESLFKERITSETLEYLPEKIKQSPPPPEEATEEEKLPEDKNKPVKKNSKKQQGNEL